MKLKKSQLIFLALSILITIFIFSNSLASATESDNMSSVFFDIAKSIFAFFNITEVESLHHIIRKLAHFSEFLLQSIFVSSFFIKGDKPFKEKIIYVLFIGLLTASTDEFIQIFSDGRGSHVSDVFIDFSGCISGLLLCIGYNKIKLNKSIVK